MIRYYFRLTPQGTVRAIVRYLVDQGLWEKWDTVVKGWRQVPDDVARQLQQFVQRGELGLDQVTEDQALALAPTL
jgi:hypothetical protein